MFWKIIDLIISHLGKNPNKGGSPPNERNKIIKDSETEIGILEIEDI